MPAVAIVQTAFIGDVVLASPLFKAARRNCPKDTIIAVVRKGCENLVETNPNIDKVVVWDKHGADKGFDGMLRVAGRLRTYDISIALIPHRSFRTGLTMMLAHIKKRVGFAKGSGSLLHTQRVIYRQGIHEVERNLMLAETLGWDTDGCSPVIFPDTADCEKVDSVVGSPEKLCVLAPGSVWATKKWPKDYYIISGNAFAKQGYTIAVSGGPADRDICGSVAESIPGAIDTSGGLTLRQSAELYRRALFVLTGDSAPQHIAAAMGVTVFAIFGPTIRDFGFWPYSDCGMVIEEAGLECRPCNIHGSRRCPIGTHVCMKNITPERVINLIEQTLNRKKAV